MARLATADVAEIEALWPQGEIFVNIARGAEVRS